MVVWEKFDVRWFFTELSGLFWMTKNDKGWFGGWGERTNKKIGEGDLWKVIHNYK